MKPAPDPFARQLEEDRQVERRLAWRELGALAIVALVVFLRLRFGG